MANIPSKKALLISFWKRCLEKVPKLIILPMVVQDVDESHGTIRKTKKHMKKQIQSSYFPLNPDCLIRIIAMVYCNPNIPG